MPRKRPFDMHIRAVTGPYRAIGETDDQCRENDHWKCTYKSQRVCRGLEGKRMIKRENVQRKCTFELLQVRIGLEGRRMSNATKTSTGNVRTSCTSPHNVRRETNEQCLENLHRKCTYESLQVRIGLEGRRMSNSAKTSIGNARTSCTGPHSVRRDTNEQFLENLHRKCTYESLQVRIELEGRRMSNAAKTSIGNSRTSCTGPYNIRGEMDEQCRGNVHLKCTFESLRVRIELEKNNLN